MFIGISNAVTRLQADTGLRFLFANGEAGAWYDPRDLSTLFQDAAGTTPVATDADVVGLAVDTSEGGLNSLGPELVTNGEFEDDLTGWSSFSGATISNTGSAIQITNPVGDPFGAARQIDIGEAGKVYQVSVNLLSKTAAALLRVGASDLADAFLDIGDNTFFVTADGVMSVYLCASGDAAEAVFDNISVREIPGNHASQSTTSYKPKWYSPNILRFDGVDDRLITTLKPTTTGSIAMRFKGSTASRVAFGAQPASDGKCYLGLASDGSIAGGIGTQATSIIKGSTDKRGVETTAILTWDGSTVTLYEDGVSVYSAAQSGAVDTANAFNFGSLNNAGSSAAHFDGDVSNLIVTDDVITASEALKIHNKWSA